MNIKKYKNLLIAEEEFEAYKAVCFRDPDSVVDFMREHVYEGYILPQEQLYVIGLDVKGHFIGVTMVSQGSAYSSVSDPKDVFRAALLMNAISILLVHNHPSGDPTPSEEDKTMTKTIAKAGDLLCLRVMDHIVIGDDSYVSMRAAGLF